MKLVHLHHLKVDDHFFGPREEFLLPEVRCHRKQRIFFPINPAQCERKIVVVSLRTLLEKKSRFKVLFAASFYFGKGFQVQ